MKSAVGIFGVGLVLIFCGCATCDHANCFGTRSAEDDVRTDMKQHLSEKGWQEGINGSGSNAFFVVCATAEVAKPDVPQHETLSRTSAFRTAQLKAKAELLRIRDGMIEGTGNVRGFMIEGIHEHTNANGRVELGVVAVWSAERKALLDALLAKQPIPAAVELPSADQIAKASAEELMGRFGAVLVRGRNGRPIVYGFGMAGSQGGNVLSRRPAFMRADADARQAIAMFLDGTVKVSSRRVEEISDMRIRGLLQKRSWSLKSNDGRWTCNGVIAAWNPSL